MGTREKIKAALKATATFRGSKPDQTTLTLYSNRLARETEEDVLLALEKLAEMPRHEYESALPDIGGVLALVDVCRIARQNRAEIEKNKKLFYFRCPDCGFEESGYFAPAAVIERRCRSFYSRVEKRGDPCTLAREGQICGGKMVLQEFVPYKEPAGAL